MKISLRIGFLTKKLKNYTYGTLKSPFYTFYCFYQNDLAFVSRWFLTCEASKKFGVPHTAFLVLSPTLGRLSPIGQRPIERPIYYYNFAKSLNYAMKTKSIYVYNKGLSWVILSLKCKNLLKRMKNVDIPKLWKYCNLKYF